MPGRLVRTAAPLLPVVLAAIALLSVLTVGPSLATPRDVTVSELIDLCRSTSIADAAAKGERLGWRRTSAAESAEWRSSFTRHLGGTVEVVGWRRDAADTGDSLSFWIARGPNAHRACAYTTRRAAGLRDALVAAFGPPSSSDETEITSTAFWKLATAQVAFSRVSSTVYVNISFTE